MDEIGIVLFLVGELLGELLLDLVLVLEEGGGEGG